MTKTYFSVVFLLMMLVGCSGSDSYRGKWKAMDGTGAKLELTFAEKSMQIKDSTGKIQKYGYTQHSVRIVNSITTYGIQLDNGNKLKINFPLAKKDDIAVMKTENGDFVFTLCRKKYMRPEQVPLNQ